MVKLFKGKDDTHYVVDYKSSKGQLNSLVGKVGSDTHCHLYNDTNGNSGVVHRGDCKVCDDKNS